MRQLLQVHRILLFFVCISLWIQPPLGHLFFLRKLYDDSRNELGKHEVESNLFFKYIFAFMSQLLGITQILLFFVYISPCI